MSSASRHVCRTFLRTSTRSIVSPTRKVLARRSHQQQQQNTRSFTSTPFYRADPPSQSKSDRTPKGPDFEDEDLQVPEQVYTTADLDPEERAHYETLSKTEQTHYMAIQNHVKAITEGVEGGDLMSEDEHVRFARHLERTPEGDALRLTEEKDLAAIKDGYWAIADEDDEFTQVPDGDDEVTEDAITSVAESELEVHREIREYTRIAAWDLPMLLQLVKPFEPPSSTKNPLRFRYTTYMGEAHPAQSKVVVDFNVTEVAEASKLTAKQRTKLVKLLGVRYNPDKDLGKMSCEKFENAAQNKRYLGDLVQNLVKEAQDSADTFEDIPLDFRHHKPKKDLRFPDAWKMSPRKVDNLLAEREELHFLEEAQSSHEVPEQVEEKVLVNGRTLLADYVSSKTTQPNFARPL